MVVAVTIRARLRGQHFVLMMEGGARVRSPRQHLLVAANSVQGQENLAVGAARVRVRSARSGGVVSGATRGGSGNPPNALL